MAASGAQTIQLYYSTTSGTAPVAGNLASGEIALNITDGKLYYKDNGGTVQVLATKGTGPIGGANTQVQYNNNGALAGSGNLTFDGTTLTAAGLSTGGSLTLSGGTANGVAYLNGSKVLTTGSVLTFDGAQLGVNGVTVGRGAGAVSTNTAVGASALAANTTGGNNTMLGFQAGYNSTSDRNTFIGRSSGQNTTSSDNTFVGYAAGYYVTSGAKNVILGGYNGNQGGLDIRTASNYIVLSDGDGNLILNAQNNATLALQGAITKAGTGITFPATQSASSDANTLDDYEEGTFTFTLTGQTTAPSTPQTTTGYYTKIGRFVTVSAYFNDKDLTGASGDLKATGLPFTSDSSSTNRGAHSCALYGFTFTGSLYVDLSVNVTHIYFQESRSNTSWTPIAVSAASGKYVQVTLNYMTST